MIMIKFLNKYLKLGLLLVMVVAIILTVIFLYENFYKTLIGAERVTVLQQQVSPVSFKEKSWNQVMSNLDEKLAPKPQITRPNNPFKQ